MAIWTSQHTSPFSPVFRGETKAVSVNNKGWVQEWQMPHAGTMVLSFHAQHRYHHQSQLFPQIWKQCQSLVHTAIQAAGPMIKFDSLEN